MSARSYLRKHQAAGVAALEGSVPIEMEIQCPYCASALAVRSENVGSEVNCYQCSGAILISAPVAAPSIRRSGGGESFQPPHPAIFPCIVISLLLNVLCAIAWCFTVVLFFVAAIPIIMALIEVSFLVSSGSRPRRQVHKSAFSIGMMEVILGLLSCNIISLICGGIVMASSGD